MDYTEISIGLDLIDTDTIWFWNGNVTDPISVIFLGLIEIGGRVRAIVRDKDFHHNLYNVDPLHLECFRIFEG